MVKCRDLNEQLGDNAVRDRDLVNMAPLELGKEVPKIQFLLLVRADLLWT
jgi:hypothetical protein